MPGKPPARRTVLRAAALAPAVGLGLTACSSGEGGSNRSAPTAPVDLGASDDVKVGASKLYTDENVVVSRISEDEYKAYSSVCTHARCPINKLEGHKLICQCHGSQLRRHQRQGPPRARRDTAARAAGEGGERQDHRPGPGGIVLAAEEASGRPGPRPGAAGLSVPASRLSVMADPSSYRPKPGQIPDAPGVYKFRDEHRRVIYVGKAKSLRQRLANYFQDLAGLHPRTRSMVTTAASVEWTVVNNEVEALQLEYSWIKDSTPGSTSSTATTRAPLPRGDAERTVPAGPGDARPQEEGVRYFGPYSHAWAIRDTVDLLLRLPGPYVLRPRVQRRPHRPPLPPRIHRQVLGALCGARHPRGPQGARRGLLRLHGGPHLHVRSPP
ncbi:UvrABC system protein C [Streptomyces alboniger]